MVEKLISNIEDRKGISQVEMNLRNEISGLHSIITDLQNEIQRLKNELSGCVASLASG